MSLRKNNVSTQDKNKTEEQMGLIDKNRLRTVAADDGTGTPKSRVIENTDRTVVQMIGEEKEDRLIDFATLAQEILAAGVDGGDLLTIKKITSDFDYRDNFDCAYRVYKWANWLVAVKLKSVESLVLPSDVIEVLTLSAPTAYLDGKADFYLHIGTNENEMVKDASISSEMVKDGSISNKMVKDASISNKMVKDASISNKMVKDASISDKMPKDESVTEEEAVKTATIFVSGEFKRDGLYLSAFNYFNYPLAA